MTLALQSNSAIAAPDAAALIAAARQLLPRLRQRAAQCEAGRSIPAATLAELHEIGLFDIIKPSRYGGYQLGWDVFNEVTVALASGCGSTGWVYGVIGSQPLVATRFGNQFMDEMWGSNPRAMMASCRRIAGALRRVPGGFRGSGIGSFSSGCLHVDWVNVSNMPAEGEDKKLTIVLPKRDTTVLDTWHAMGMAGTGSHDVRFDEVFIPDHRVYGDDRPPAGGTVDAPVYRTQQHGGPFALAAAALGIAAGFVEQYTLVAAGRVTRGVKVADQQSMQMRIGESALQIEAALALLRAGQKELMAQCEGIPPSGELRTGLSAVPQATREQALGAYVAHAAYEAVERLFRVIGANQLKLSEPLQRAFRDITSAIQQPFNNIDVGQTLAGRALLTQATALPS